MKKVTKHDLVLDTSQSSGHSQIQTKKITDEFLKVIGELMAQNHTVEIRKFGTFHSKLRKSRPARNPQTGEVCMLPPFRAPLFKFSVEITDKLGEVAGVTESLKAGNKKPEKQTDFSPQ